MDCLVYLLAHHRPESLNPSPHEGPLILCGGRKSCPKDEDVLQQFSEILLHLNADQTYDALYTRLPVCWYEDQPYDMINPYGDVRERLYRSLWTFDTRKDVLYHANRHRRSRLPLSLLRERPVSMADMERIGCPLPLRMSANVEPSIACWQEDLEIDERHRAFLHRLLRDFDYQWRHILRADYSFTTLRILARAIISLATLDFDLREHNGGPGLRGAHVWNTQLPAWEPLKTDVIRMGGFHLVLCRDMSEGLAIAKMHFLDQKVGDAEDATSAGKMRSPGFFMILSIRHIMLCRPNDSGSLVNTAAEPLFHGQHDSTGPSDQAIDFLLLATASVRPSIRTPLQSLPCEVQDMILAHVSLGTVKAARLGCLLGIGTPFMWTQGAMKVTREDRHTNRVAGYGIESQVWFGDCKSGLVYMARPPKLHIVERLEYG